MSNKPILVLKQSTGATLFQQIGEGKTPSVKDLFGVLGSRKKVGVLPRLGALAGLAGKTAAAGATALQTAHQLQSGNLAAPLGMGYTYAGYDPTSALSGITDMANRNIKRNEGEQARQDLASNPSPPMGGTRPVQTMGAQPQARPSGPVNVRHEPRAHQRAKRPQAPSFVTGQPAQQQPAQQQPAQQQPAQQQPAQQQTIPFNPNIMEQPQFNVPGQTQQQAGFSPQTVGAAFGQQIGNQNVGQTGPYAPSMPSTAPPTNVQLMGNAFGNQIQSQTTQQTLPMQQPTQPQPTQQQPTQQQQISTALHPQMQGVPAPLNIPVGTPLQSQHAQVSQVQPGQEGIVGPYGMPITTMGNANFSLDDEPQEPIAGNSTFVGPDGNVHLKRELKSDDFVQNLFDTMGSYLYKMTPHEAGAFAVDAYFKLRE